MKLHQMAPSSTQMSFMPQFLPQKLLLCDPVFRKAQEASMAPQQYKERGRGLKDKTLESIMRLESVIWD